MTNTILNGANQPINIQTGTVPNVGGAMLDWFQPMTFIQVTKSVTNFQVVETEAQTDFFGVIQPLTDRVLQIKSEGQRAWTWFWLHAQPVLVLEVDDIVEYLGVRYRIMSRVDQTLYGYVSYTMVQDWTGSIPGLSFTILQYGLTMPGVAA